MAELHDKIWQIAMDSLGNTFPDGDPIDEIIEKLIPLGFYEPGQVGEILDESFQVREGKTWNAFLADFWDDAVSDFDPAYRIQLFGTDKPQNPWRS